jgi:hypothetical protein
MTVYTGMEQAGSLSCLNRLLHEVLGCAPAVILTVLFCKVKISPLLEELPQKIFLYFIIE